MGGPSNPAEVGVIRKITDDVTIVSLPFMKDDKFKVGGRMTIVKMQSGAIFVVSPVAITEPIKEVLASYGGNVQYIVAPDIEHHAFIPEWAKAYPDAKFFGPEGLPEKRKAAKAEEVAFAYVLTKDNKATIESTFPEDVRAEFEIEYVNAHFNKEIGVFHKPSRSLITADLLFNLPAVESYSKSPEDPTSGLPSKIFNFLLKGNGVLQGKFLSFSTGKADRPSMTDSIKRMLAWDWDRVIMSHGDVVETGGKKFAEHIWHAFI